ncbi:MAG: rhomboid family intramembrane serine protease [Flavobacteriaceae bacterium]
MYSLNIYLLIIIALNGIISYKGFNDYSFFEKFKFNVGAVKSGEHYRNISSGFLHADMQHLLFNMVTLFFFAPIVIAYLGAYHFILIYITSLLFGSLLSLYFHKNEPHYSAIGASGAVTGVLFSAILLQPMMTINFFIPGWIFGIGYLFYSIYGMKNRVGNIGHTAHFGGAIGGYLLTLLLGADYVFATPVMTALIGVPIIVLFVLMKLKKV